MMRFAFKALQSQSQSEADIRLYTEIGESWWGDSTTASDFAAMLDELGAVSRVNLYVNSPGGDIFDGQAMTSALRRMDAHVTVIVDGLMASAATFFLDAADEVLMAPSSELMIHDGFTFAMGNADDLRKQADVIDMLSQQIAGIYARRAGGTVDDWRALMRAETWFTGEEAVAAGLADSVVDAQAQDVPAAARLGFKFAGRSAAPFPAAAMAIHTSRPARAETAPAPPAIITKEIVVTDVAAQPESKGIDGNAIEALLKFQFDAFESKIHATNDATMQKFIDALEPAPTVAEVKAAVLADMKPRKGVYASLIRDMAARATGNADGGVMDRLNSALASSQQSVFRDAFTYGSGGTALEAEQFVGELIAVSAYRPVVWDLISPFDLVSDTVYGGAATTLPAGGTYAGGGTVVSSTAPVWARETLAASLYALAAGLPRINFDFNRGQQLLDSFFRYAVRDYGKWRDTLAITNILGTSTGFFGALSSTTAPKPPTNSVVQDAVAKIAAGIVQVAVQGGGTANFALVTQADFTALMEASHDQAPAFWTVDLARLTSGEVEGSFAVRLDSTGTVSAGNVLVGNGIEGMSGYELPGGGVRAEQIVVSTATYDTGLFGYAAPFRENANFFAKVTAVATS